MRLVYRLIVIMVVLLVSAAGKHAVSSSAGGLAIRQEPNRVVLQWNGPVAPPMRDRIDAAIAQFADDPRPLVLSLNSPGGFVEHGREVIRTIHKASRARAIDTMVERGSMCASMCVPIFLVGAERSADPAARFMFHEASFRLKPDVERQVSQMRGLRQAITDHVTSELFDDDIGTRSVDAHWLAAMREKIRGRDVWMTGRQLVDEGSGVVDKLF